MWLTVGSIVLLNLYFISAEAALPVPTFKENGYISNVADGLGGNTAKAKNNSTEFTSIFFAKRHNIKEE